MKTLAVVAIATMLSATSASAQMFVGSDSSPQKNQVDPTIRIGRCTETNGAVICKSPNCAVKGRSGDAASVARPGTMAALVAEGYRIARVEWSEGTIYLRRPYIFEPTYVCTAGPIGSPRDEAFVTCKYDQLTCSRAPDGYP
jgi:hypothetical protein